MNVTSPAFADGARIPDAYVSSRAGGQDRSIPVDWSGAPETTVSFAVTIVDHAPIAREFVHWVVVDIPPDVTSLGAGVSGRVLPVARELQNTAGRTGYAGPMPPAGSGEHPYEVAVYALSTPKLEVPERPSATDLDRALRGSVIASASVTGIYSR